MCRLIKMPTRIMTKPAMVRSQPAMDFPLKKRNPIPMMNGINERPNAFI